MATRGDTIRHSTTLVVEECPACHIVHGIPATLRDLALERSQAAPGETLWVFCPNGHRWSYTGRNEAQRLKEQLEWERQYRLSISAQADQLKAEVKHERSRVKGYQGQLAKTKKRIGNGVCPCCNRHFTNVERHMASKHPNYSQGGA